MKNIALYGGAFDPPHNGHLGIIQSLSQAPEIDEVWLLPCGDRLDKQLLIPTKLRFQLMRDLFKDNKRIKVSEDQIQMSKQLGTQIHTYDLLNQFNKSYEGARFHFVIGADIIHSIHTWGNAEKLVKQHNFIVFNRKGYQLDKSKLPANIKVIENQSVEISSSYLKQVMKDSTLSREDKRKSLEPWINELVFKNLADNQLI